MFDIFPRCFSRRKRQTKRESRELRILYVNMITETQQKNLDLHQNKFKGVKKQKPVITRKVIN